LSEAASHHAAHPAALAHQFDNLEQQKEAATLGMWVFLLTEILFFGGLFAAYTLYRYRFPEAFIASSRELIVWAGTLNTVVLITSSLLLFLTLTMALGCVFLGVKAFEYYEEITAHHVPGLAFQFEAEHFRNAQIFFSLYFMMTGLHAVHMVIGLGIMSVMWWWAYRGVITPEYYNPIEVTGLYWHFVDIVWIFLFPLLYLIGRHVH
jgi:cytochrome c oxidase subunit 3